MKDFLKGTIGKMLQILLGIIGLSCFVFSFGSCIQDNMGQGYLLIFIGFLCFATSFGIRYWLGYIIKTR